MWPGVIRSRLRFPQKRPCDLTEFVASKVVNVLRRWRSVLLFACILFLSVSGFHPSFAETAGNPWKVFKPLGETSQDTKIQYENALERTGEIAEPLRKALFYRRMDTPLERFFKSYRESFSTLDFSSLYELEDVPWSSGQDGHKTMVFEGYEEDGFYRLEKADTLSLPVETGESYSSVDLKPQENGFLLRNRRYINFGPLDEVSLHEIFQRYAKYLNLTKFGSEGNDFDPKKVYGKSVRKYFPNLVDFLKNHLRVKSIGSIGSDEDGNPVTRIKFRIELDPESFREEHPEFYRLCRNFLQPSGLKVEITDRKDRRLFKYRRDGLVWTQQFATRDGKLFPYDRESGTIVNNGKTPIKIRRTDMDGEVSTWVNLYGMRFGMTDFEFTSEYEDGMVTWTYDEAPEIDLPFGFNLILSPFIQPFLEYLRTGENGQGIYFKEGFQESQYGTIGRNRLKLPLKDSPFVTFILKLNSLTWQPFDESARKDLDKFGRKISERIREDFQKEWSRLGPVSD